MDRRLRLRHRQAAGRSWLLEPDGLGIIPWYDPYGGADGSNALEWCQPAEADPATPASDRFAMLDHAVDVLEHALPNVTTYLDGTHSAWLGSGDIAQRLVLAGVADAAGFYLNVSNYHVQRGSTTWSTAAGSRRASPTRARPLESRATRQDMPEPVLERRAAPGQRIDWTCSVSGTGVALDRFGEWSDDSDEPTLNTSGINLRYKNMLGGVEPTAHYVIDTSRNGEGPWAAPAYPGPAGLVQPDRSRARGSRRRSSTGEALVDAYLWVKIPGESDGECTRGLGPAPARPSIPSGA